MTRTGSCLIVIFLLASCGQKKDGSLERVVIPFDHPTQNLSEVVSGVSYIPLRDLAPHFLGNIDKLILTDDLIIAGDISTRERINMYDTMGNFLSTIRHFGEGPGEFTHISDFGYDPARKLISVSLVGKIIFYDLEGRFVEEFKTDVLYKMHVLAPNGQVVFYLPQLIAPEFTGTAYSDGIVFLGDPKEKTAKKILGHTFSEEVRTPYMKERTVFRFGKDGELAFSHHFNDTVYVFDPEFNLNRKILVDLGPYRMDNEHFQKYDDWVVALNNYGEKALNQNNLIYDGDYLGGRISWKGKTYCFLSEFRTKKTWLMERFVNDVDGGLNSFQIRAIKDKILYSVHMSDRLISRKREGGFEATLPENIEDNLFFIAKYHLKD